jgi:HEAT repeat protein
MIIFINEIEDEETEEYNSSNKNVIKYLCYHLNDYDEKVRLASSISLGRISKPDGESSIKEILKVINVEKNISVLSSMLWALGKNLNPSNIEIIPILIKYIQSDIWKVRRTALFALSKFGSIAAEQAIPILSKLLIDSPINKSLIAEVIVTMGNLGENKLVEIIEKNDKND